MAKNKPEKEKGIKYDGVSFSREFLLSHKSESEFLKVMKGQSYAHIFKGENREAKLKEVYAIVKPKKITAVEPEK